ncbi:MAG: redoxin family protein [Desulfuromonadaceae bacterium]|jgi:thiol peroxidase|nr:redoxin family protein [Desulfuromonadaceae bacterium]
MKRPYLVKVITLIVMVLLAGCSRNLGSDIPVDLETAAPGGTVTLHGEKLRLTGTPLRIGNPLPATVLVDAFSMKKVDLTQLKGKVLIVSLVPSLDTKVCETQTHQLGELASRLPEGIDRITISRDTPFAQKRFADEAKLTGITYLSDYRDGSFGRATGLLQEESMLLARAVILVDREGVVRYIQVVPELSHLPDIKTVADKANALFTGK